MPNEKEKKEEEEEIILKPSVPFPPQEIPPPEKIKTSNLEDDNCQLNNIKIRETIYFDEEYNNGNSGTAITIDWKLGQKQKLTLTGNATLTFTAPRGPCNLILKVVQDATGSRTITWPSAVKWPGGTAPTLTTTASATDIIALYYDGTNYYSQASLNFS